MLQISNELPRSSGPHGRGPGSGSGGADRMSLLEDDAGDEEAYRPRAKEVDSSYADPLGPMPERPKTSAGPRQAANEDEFADEEIGDDLLPE